MGEVEGVPTQSEATCMAVEAPEHLTVAGEKKQVKILLAEPSSGSVDSWVYDNRKE